MMRATVVISLIAAFGACHEQPDPLLSYGAGFDPLHFDAGALPEVKGVEGIRFAVPPFYGPQAESARTALENYLTDAVGVKVHVESVEAYGTMDLGRAVANGEFDVADLAPFPFVKEQASQGSLVPLVTTVSKGSMSYGSYILTAPTGPQTLSALTERLKAGVRPKIAVASRSSTSGYLVPSAALLERGVELELQFEVVSSGSHQEALEKLKRGEVEFAAVSTDIIHPEDFLNDHVRLFMKAGRIPYDVIAARRGLDANVSARLTAALLGLSIHRQEHREALKAFSAVDAFMPVPRGHYESIYALLNVVRENKRKNPSP